MRTDDITEIGINTLDQLFVKPKQERFTLIWRSATEVHWNEKENFLYSPKPREWSYLDWYKQIVSVVKNEHGCVLKVSHDTIWLNLSVDLKKEIMAFNSTFTLLV